MLLIRQRVHHKEYARVSSAFNRYLCISVCMRLYKFAVIRIHLGFLPLSCCWFFISPQMLFLPAAYLNFFGRLDCWLPLLAFSILTFGCFWNYYCISFLIKFYCALSSNTFTSHLICKWTKCSCSVVQLDSSCSHGQLVKK